MLDLWRFIFCICVVLLHMNGELGVPVMGAGYLGVEFFLIVSGYYMAERCHRDYCKKKLSFSGKLKAVITYIKSRLIRLYPLYILAFLITLIFTIVLQQISRQETLQLLKDNLGEVFLLQSTGLLGGGLNYPDWYVSAIFFAGIGLYLLFLFAGSYGAWGIIPVFSAAIYLYFNQKIGKIDVIVSYYGLLRALAGMGVGVLCFALVYVIQAHFKEIKWLRSLELSLSTVLFGGIIVYMNFGHRGSADFVVIGVMALATTLLMLAAPVLEGRRARICMILGEISFPIYLFQITAIDAVKAFMLL